MDLDIPEEAPEDPSEQKIIIEKLENATQMSVGTSV